MAEGLQQFMPADYMTEQQRLLRRQKLSDLMLQQALQPKDAGQMVSGRYVPNPIGTIADVVKTLTMAKMGEKNDADRASLAQRYQADLTGEMGRIRGLMQPQEIAGPPAENETMGTTPADPRAAITQALMSRFPQVNEYGEKLEKAHNDRFTAGLRGVAPKSTVQSVAQAVQNVDLTQVQPDKPKYGETGVLFKGPDGKPVLGAKELSTNEPKYAPGGGATATASLMTGENHLEKQVVEDVVKRGSELRGKTLPALENLQSQSRMLSEGAKTGLIQPEFELVKNFVHSLTGEQIDPTQPITQAQRTLMKDALFKEVGSFGAQFSDADRRFVEQTLASDRMSKDAVHELNALRAKYLVQGIERHNAYIDQQLAAGMAKQAPDFLRAQKIQAPDLKLDGRTQVYYLKHTRGLSTEQAARELEQTNYARGDITDKMFDPKTGDTLVSFNGGFTWRKLKKAK